jgi:predicted enzyme related to lactoylglutathione lyase
MTVGNRSVHDFCWINVLTPEPAKAREFFSALLGWSYEEMPGGIGHLAKTESGGIGGVFDLAMPGMPKLDPTIGLLIKVAEAKGACDKARSLGATAEDPFAVADRGIMLSLHDPTGARIAGWQPVTKPGMDADSSKRGVPSWFELETGDPARAATFYAGLFGWTAEPMDMGGVTYTVFRLGKDAIAGMTKEAGAPRWVTYFTVDDADAAAAAATKLGGRVTREPHDVPGVGRTCGLVSPQGVAFHAIAHAR